MQKTHVIYLLFLIILILLCGLFLTGYLQNGINQVLVPSESTFDSQGIHFTCPAGWSLSSERIIDNNKPQVTATGIKLIAIKEHAVNCEGTGVVHVYWAEKIVDLNNELNQTSQDITRSAIPYSATNINLSPISQIVFNGLNALSVNYSYTIDFGTSGVEPGGPIETSYFGQRIAFNCGNSSVILSMNSEQTKNSLNTPYFDKIKSSFTCNN